MKSFLSILAAVLITVVIMLSVVPLLKSNEHTNTVTQTVTIPGDSIPYPVTVKVPVPYDSVVVDTFYCASVIDTAEILKDYYSKYFYQDTIKSNSVTAILCEEVTQNRITGRQVFIQNLRPQAITNKYVEPANKIYAGLIVSDYNSKIGLGPSLIYARNRDAFNINVDILNTGISAGYYIRFK
jgi:hypothetical protein